MLEMKSVVTITCKIRSTVHRTRVKRQPLSRVQVYRGDVSGSSARIALDASNRRQQQQRNDARLQDELAAQSGGSSDKPSRKRKDGRSRSDTKAPESGEVVPREARDWVGEEEVDLTIYDTLDEEAERASRGRGASPRASTATPPENGSIAAGVAADEALRRKALQLKSNLRAQNRASAAYRPSTALGLARRRMLNKYLPYEWQVALKKKAEEIPETQFNYIVSGLTLITTSLLAGLVAWNAWPFLRETVITFFHANDIEARVLQELTFETQFLSAISLVTAILLGNTFAFSFDRQRQIIQEMSEEVFAVELLLQEAFLALSEPHLRWRIIKYVKMYVETEIQTRTTDSPFRVDGAIVGLFSVLSNLRSEGKDITRMLRAVEMLAQANSRRVAVAAALLPPLHWVMLASLCSMLLVAFILFDSDFNDQVIENRVIFALLAAMLYSILQVLQDISTPDDGLYSVRDAMDHRLTYVRWQMGHILNDPAIKISILGGDVSEDPGDSMDDDREVEKSDQEAQTEDKLT